VEVGVAAAPLELLALRVVEVVDEDLLGERQAAAEAATADGDPFREGRVHLLDELDRRAGFHGHGAAPRRRVAALV
jgi:hypothetical protein